MMETEQCDEITINVTDSEASPDNPINIWSWPARSFVNSTANAQYIGTLLASTGIFHWRPTSIAHVEVRREDDNLADVVFEAHGFNYVLGESPLPPNLDINLSVLNTDEPLPDNDHFVDASGIVNLIEVWKKTYHSE